MRGGLVPLSCQELQGLISAVQVKMGTFPIQSQHEGNCASDAIQIILYFSDGIGMKVATTAIRDYKAREYGDIYNETDIHQKLATVTQGTGVAALGEMYGRLTGLRFLRLIDEYYSLLGNIQYKAMPRTLYRAPSRSRAFMTPTIPVGVMCSSVFAIRQQKLTTAAEILKDKPGRNELYPYHPTIYDPIVTALLNKFAPGSELQSGLISGQEQKYLNELTVFQDASRKNRISGVQLFCIEGTARRGFHTFSLFRRNGVWYIGDNEVGLAVNINYALTLEDILTHRISFQAARAEAAQGLYAYSRTYYKQKVEDDGRLGESIQIAKADYFLQAATSGSYNASYEDVFTLPRRYFLAPPGAPNCPGPSEMGGRRRKTYKNRNRLNQQTRRR